MSTSVTVGGLTYFVPAVGENNWGQNVTDLLIAITQNISGGGFFTVVSVASSPITVLSGRTYLVDTSSARTLNLPAPAVGAYLLVRDKTGSAATNAITLHRNGSEQIDGASADKTLIRNNGTWIVLSDGTNWYTLNQFSDSGIVASTGYLRLANLDQIAWRNVANSANLTLGIDGSNNLIYNSSILALMSGWTPGTFIVTTGGGLLTTLAPPIIIAFGGTNSVAALNNNRIMQSTGGAIVEAAAITANRALTSDANGIPVAAPSGVTDTQIGYLLNLFKYRRPVLQYNSGTVVNVETGLNGTSGDCAILFPDGQLRTDSDTTRIRMTITQNAVFNNATRANNVGGLRSGAAANNTWYPHYAVKVTAGSGAATDFVIVADTVLPIQANFATLNSNFGTNGWVYLGLAPYGDGVTGNAFKQFKQAGNMTMIDFAVTAGNVFSTNGTGIRLATTSGATSLTFTYASGTNIATPQIPSNVGFVQFMPGFNGRTATTDNVTNSAGTIMYLKTSNGNASAAYRLWTNPDNGLKIVDSLAGNDAFDIFLVGWIDTALGVGTNPVL